MADILHVYAYIANIGKEIYILTLINTQVSGTINQRD
jgi:hypothetical protein